MYVAKTGILNHFFLCPPKSIIVAVVFAGRECNSNTQLPRLKTHVNINQREDERAERKDEQILPYCWTINGAGGEHIRSQFNNNEHIH